MQRLKEGTYYGAVNRKFKSNELIISDAVYTLDKVDWHYHENPYFTFIIAGNLLEGSRKGIHQCTAGDLLFHNWQDPHYNSKPDGFTRGFHIELGRNWCWNGVVCLDQLQGNMDIRSPAIRLLFHQLFFESFIQDNSAALATDSLLLNAFSLIQEEQIVWERRIPEWAYTLRDYLRENYKKDLSLSAIAGILDLHPVYLSREFSRYFGVTMGSYIRKLKVENALLLFRQPSLSLTEIGYMAGFADQSHFIRCFRDFLGVTPGQYRERTNS